MPKVGYTVRNDWAELIDETVKTAIVARNKARDWDEQQHPFDAKAHSTRIGIGTHVGYSHLFLKSIGCSALDPMWFARGHVTYLKQLGTDTTLAAVKWHGKNWKDFPSKVNVFNLAPVGPNLKFCGG